MCPIFDYQCKCGILKENELVKDSAEVVECKCGRPMDKIYNFAPRTIDPNKVYSTNREADVDEIFDHSQF